MVDLRLQVKEYAKSNPLLNVTIVYIPYYEMACCRSGLTLTQEKETDMGYLQDVVVVGRWPRLHRPNPATSQVSSTFASPLTSFLIYKKRTCIGRRILKIASVLALLTHHKHARSDPCYAHIAGRV